MAPPTLVEYFAIYACLSVIMLIAIVNEIRTTRIPNSFTFPVFVYFLCARLILGPSPFQEYLASLGIIAFVYVGIGFLSGYVPGGAGKFAIALAPALELRMAFAAAAISLLVGGVLWILGKIWTRPGMRIPGSIVISSIFGSVALSAILRSIYQLGGTQN
ncbi:MAG: hypothetical protein JWM11_2998 [Planctomycetaceae bacterium]|nr:hypothetical protein [Planctomycetaceae bacterium]